MKSLRLVAASSKLLLLYNSNVD